MATETARTVIAVRVPPTFKRRIERLAEQGNMTTSEFIRHALDWRIKLSAGRRKASLKRAR